MTEQTAHSLLRHILLRQRINNLKTQRDELREECSTLGKQSASILEALSPEDRATLQAWVGQKDKLSLTQGEINGLQSLTSTIHDMEAELGGKRRKRNQKSPHKR